MKNYKLTLATIAVTLTTSYAHASIRICSDLFGVSAGSGQAEQEVIHVPARKRTYRETSTFRLRDEEKPFFQGRAEWVARQKNDELINLAWVRNHAGFLSESKSVDEYMIIFAELLKNGQDFDVRDDMGRTPLMQAAITGYLNMQMALLKIGVRVDLVDKDSRTAADLAMMIVPGGVMSELYYVEKYMTYQGYYIRDAAFDAFNSRDFNALQGLFDRGVYVDIFDHNLGRSLLTLAIEKNDLEMAEFLLKNGADPNYRMRGENTGKFYPVLVAAREIHFEALTLLLKYGGDINSTGLYEYETNAVRQALWSAAFEANELEPQLKMLDWLLDHGADPDFERTPEGYKKPLALKKFVEEELFPAWKTSSRVGLLKRKSEIVAVLRKHGLW